MKKLNQITIIHREILDRQSKGYFKERLDVATINFETDTKNNQLLEELNKSKRSKFYKMTVVKLNAKNIKELLIKSLNDDEVSQKLINEIVESQNIYFKDYSTYTNMSYEKLALLHLYVIKKNKIELFIK